MLALMSAVALAFTPAPVAADATLIVAEPAPGAVLSTAPPAVDLRFGAEVSAPDSHVVVMTADGRDVSEHAATPLGPQRLSVQLRPGASGDLTIGYHVVFLDGASTSGAYRISVGTGVSPAPLSAEAQRAVTMSVTGHGHQIDPASAVLLLLDGAVLAGALFLLWVRPRDVRRAWSYRGR
ncbi:hypothetical protein Aca07nite_64830 [Actinoplanes capillaceus]|uniref:CopC domain-containing protein n=1 Tax=Actinoplanes campanulatus TaxID=113559 RepID=A0ABQ3WSL6_9ACTN|nr:hypothetical protein Aca07nite_64830 [Actinoplanes capillaceus]